MRLECCCKITHSILGICAQCQTNRLPKQTAISPDADSQLLRQTPNTHCGLVPCSGPSRRLATCKHFLTANCFSDLQFILNIWRILSPLIFTHAWFEMSHCEKRSSMAWGQCTERTSLIKLAFIWLVWSRGPTVDWRSGYWFWKHESNFISSRLSVPKWSVYLYSFVKICYRSAASEGPQCTNGDRCRCV